MAPVACLELMATTVSRAPTFRFRRIWPRNVSSVPEVLQARPDHPVAQETLDRKVAMVRPEGLANLAALVLLDHLVRKEMTEDLERLVPKVHLVKMDRPAPKVPTVMRVLPVPLVQPVAKETTESQAPAAVSDHPVHQDLAAINQMMALLDNPAPLVLLAHQAKMLNTAPARRDREDLKHGSSLQIGTILLILVATPQFLINAIVVIFRKQRSIVQLQSSQQNFLLD